MNLKIRPKKSPRHSREVIHTIYEHVWKSSNFPQHAFRSTTIVQSDSTAAKAPIATSPGAKIAPTSPIFIRTSTMVSPASFWMLILRTFPSWMRSFTFCKRATLLTWNESIFPTAFFFCFFFTFLPFLQHFYIFIPLAMMVRNSIFTRLSSNLNHNTP